MLLCPPKKCHQPLVLQFPSRKTDKGRILLCLLGPGVVAKPSFCLHLSLWTLHSSETFPFQCLELLLSHFCELVLHTNFKSVGHADISCGQVLFGSWELFFFSTWGVKKSKKEVSGNKAWFHWDWMNFLIKKGNTVFGKRTEVPGIGTQTFSLWLMIGSFCWFVDWTKAGKLSHWFCSTSQPEFRSGTQCHLEAKIPGPLFNTPLPYTGVCSCWDHYLCWGGHDFPASPAVMMLCLSSKWVWDALKKEQAMCRVKNSKKFFFKFHFDHKYCVDKDFQLYSGSTGGRWPGAGMERKGEQEFWPLGSHSFHWQRRKWPRAWGLFSWVPELVQVSLLFVLFPGVPLVTIKTYSVSPHKLSGKDEWRENQRRGSKKRTRMPIQHIPSEFSLCPSAGRPWMIPSLLV